LINLASNNYLGLAADPRLVAAAQAALAQWGVGAGASRLVSGQCEAHAALEADLADFKGTEAALVFTSGYAANVGVLAALAGPRDHIFADHLNHASLVDGCRLTHAHFYHYRHKDVQELDDLLRRTPTRGQKFIVTDSLFSMDGDLAPLPALVEIAERWEAILIVDDAHGTGVIGPQGRGAVEHFGLAGRVPVQIGTLSKALGVQGGFVAGSRQLIELLIHRARSFVFSTGLAPVLAAAAREALHQARVENWRREARRRHLDRLRTELERLGYRVLGEAEAPMAAVLVGEPEAAIALATHLESRGVFAPAIRPPTVPAGTSRLRLAPMATHTEDQIESVLSAFSMARELVA
jgi:8-amino-7-oxononanoate synthase